MTEVPAGVHGEVRESDAEPHVESLPMAHVSLELGHLYREDLDGGPDAVRAVFDAVAPWVAAATGPAAAGRPKGRVRASTCFLVDDYFAELASPAEVIPMLLKAAEEAGLRIDYLARESACASAGDVRPAELALSRVVTEPVPGTTGARPPVVESGWLTNGERSPSPVAEAMGGAAAWQPPRQSAARRHSIFVDVELWDGAGRTRTWSCAMLAAVWQLLRLGMLRDGGRAVLRPQDVAPPWPASWQELPPVVRLERGAAPFTAYTTISVLSPRFLSVELAVRTILSQVAADPTVLATSTARAAQEGVALPEELVDRIRYAFVCPGTADPF